MQYYFEKISAFLYFNAIKGKLLEEFRIVALDRYGADYNISFVGMSNIGKTHWSSRAAKYLGLERIDFDGLIGQLPFMSKLIEGISGKDEAERMGKYFRMPWKEGFEKRQAEFMRGETEVMDEQSSKTGRVYDLTGSAFMHPKPMQKIANSGLVIYLEASPEAQKDVLNDLVAGFKEGPKPVCWPDDDEVPRPKSEDEFEECFAKLLAYRAKKYAEYADVTIPYEVHKNAAHVGVILQYAVYKLEMNQPGTAPQKTI